MSLNKQPFMGSLDKNASLYLLADGTRQVTGNFYPATDKGAHLGIDGKRWNRLYLNLLRCDRFDAENFLPNADNYHNLGVATLRWKDGYFSGLISLRRDSGDYGGNFVNYTPPTGREGALLVAEDTNVGGPGRRLYVYSGAAWRYVNLT